MHLESFLPWSLPTLIPAIPSPLAGLLETEPAPEPAETPDPSAIGRPRRGNRAKVKAARRARRAAR